MQNGGDESSGAYFRPEFQAPVAPKIFMVSSRTPPGPAVAHWDGRSTCPPQRSFSYFPLNRLGLGGVGRDESVVKLEGVIMAWHGIIIFDNIDSEKSMFCILLGCPWVSRWV